MNNTNSVGVEEKTENGANALLQSVERKYRRLYQNMSDAVLLYNYEEERILDCNPSALALLGFTKEELMLLNRFDLLAATSRFHPEVDIHNSMAVKHRELVYAGGTISSLAEVFNKEKQLFPAKINVVSLEKESYLAFVIVQDITKDYEKSMSLKEKERRTQIILDNSHEGIIYFCMNEKVPIDCNQKAREIFGVSNRETLLESASEYFYVTGMQNKLSAKEYFSRVIKEAKKKPYTYVYQVKDDKGGKIMIKGRAVYDDTRKEAPKVIFFIRDITEKYLANEEMNRLFDQQRQIIDAIPAPFMFRDLDGNILACNKALAESRGLEDPKEFIGLNLRDILNSEVAETVLKDDERIATSDAQVVHRRTFSYITNKGEKRWQRNDKTPFLGAEGNVTGILSYLVDVTEIMDQNERLKSYIESNRQLNNFASIASHDLQAPLRTIQSFTQLLQRKLGGRLSSEEKEYMQFISSATDNMRNLIRDLRTYSQVDAGSLNTQDFSLDKMVKEILSEIRAVINHTNASIKLTTELPIVQGDRIKLKQLIQNLLTNALKYIAKGTVPEVIIHFEDRPKYWYIEITDNGIGIEEEYQELIFELFQRLHTNTEEYQGTGIGLSLCKKVVEQHQGEIGVRSEEGKGSTFYFTFAKHIETVQDLIN